MAYKARECAQSENDYVQISKLYTYFPSVHKLTAVSNYSLFSGFGQPMTALPPISAPQQAYMSGPGSPCDECKYQV